MMLRLLSRIEVPVYQAHILHSPGATNKQRFIISTLCYDMLVVLVSTDMASESTNDSEIASYLARALRAVDSRSFGAKRGVVRT